MIKLNDFSKCPVGMILFNMAYGKCKLKNIWINSNGDKMVTVVPISLVQLNGVSDFFADGGSLIKNGPQLLYYNEPKCENHFISFTQLEQICDLKKDSPVLVKVDSKWIKRHFAGAWSGLCDNLPNNPPAIGVWREGKTSWTNENNVVEFYKEWKLQNE
jgi:hypothetical protein